MHNYTQDDNMFWKQVCINRELFPFKSVDIIFDCCNFITADTADEFFINLSIFKRDDIIEGFIQYILLNLLL